MKENHLSEGFERRNQLFQNIKESSLNVALKGCFIIALNGSIRISGCHI